MHNRLDVVRAWLDGGGDPYAKCLRCLRGHWRPPMVIKWRPLLSEAAYYGRRDMIRLLLARGADVNRLDWLSKTPVFQSIDRTVIDIATVELLLAHGADVNLNCGERFDRMSPLIVAVSQPSCVRLLLRNGGDITHRVVSSNHTTEEHARACVNVVHHPDRRGGYAASANLLEAVRLAGGWPDYFLRSHKICLVLRTLCQRGRAIRAAGTPAVLVRIFGAPGVVRHRTRAARAHDVGRAGGLPDAIFWIVLEFLFGPGPVYDHPWVRERLRLRASLTTQ